MNKAEQTKQRTWMSDVLSGALAGVLALFGSMGGVYWQGLKQMEQLELQGKRQIEFQQHVLMTEFHCKTAEAFNDAELMAHMFVERYGPESLKKESLQKGGVTIKELEPFNQLLNDLNIQLSKLYIVMPDDPYLALATSMPADTRKLREHKERVLHKLRQAQFPGTTAKVEDIRFLELLSTRPASTVPAN